MSDKREIARVEPPDPLVMLNTALSQGMKPSELGQLFDLIERRDKKHAAEKFADAITDFQAACPRIKKERAATFKDKETGQKAPAYRFANFEDIDRAVSPLLAQFRIVVTFDTEHIPGGSGMAGIRVICKVRVGTHVEETKLTVPIPGQMVVNDTQKYGAALSYAKRYAFCAALKIVVADEDDDAADLFERITPEQVALIESELKRTGKTAKAFLHWMGVAELALIPAKQWPAAQDYLRRQHSAPAGKDGAE
jgi:hypothetical protein